MENIIKKAHAAITRIKGKEYAPTSTEIQDYIDKQITMSHQTAVDWLEAKLKNIDYTTIDTSNFITCKIALHTFNKLFEKAKAMEKEQIIKAYNTSFLLRDKPYKTAEKYYNETFKSE